MFSQNFDEGPSAGGAITNLAGARLDVPNDITFSGNSVVSSCSVIATPPHTVLFVSVQGLVWQLDECAR